MKGNQENEVKDAGVQGGGRQGEMGEGVEGLSGLQVGVKLGSSWGQVRVKLILRQSLWQAARIF